MVATSVTGLIPAHAGKTHPTRGYGQPVRAHPRSRGENAHAELIIGCHAGSSPLTRGKHDRGRDDVHPLGLIPAHAGKTTQRRSASGAGWAHPRSRGENTQESTRPPTRAGSSPLTRGKPEAGRPRREPGGLIPAHAGKTGQGEGFDSTCQAHPRSRGENPHFLGRSQLWLGSSPLTRGKPARAPTSIRPARLIPAHAGKTSTCGRRSTSWTAHPRSRGENHARKVAKPGDKGSSPLTRGKRRDHAGRGPVLGLIPAHAGKTRGRPGRSFRRPAHPRSRGENSMVAGAARAAAGSSPLTRGKRRRPTQQPRLAGLIPAHAGKTQFGVPSRRDVRAHPRSRGENRAPTWPRRRRKGSSPLTRGKRTTLNADRSHVRLIPAHAGKTPIAHVWRGVRRAHPRSRGENLSSTSTQNCLPGSSPLTRGKPVAVDGELLGQGLIPAHAGKTDVCFSVSVSVQAHPRSRGENRIRIPSCLMLSGSSPLTRGKRIG